MLFTSTEVLQLVKEACYRKALHIVKLHSRTSLITRKVKLSLCPAEINFLKKKKLRVETFTTPEYSIEEYRKRTETVWFTNLYFKQLSEEIPRLQKCKEVNLDLVNCFQVSENSLLYLITKLVELPGLQSLHLTLKGEISEQGLRSFASNLSKLRRLKALSIKFWNPTDFMTDKAIAYLGHELSKLNELTDLTLNFWSCPAVTDKGIAALGRKISYLNKLKYLSINFLSCCGTKESGLESLERSVGRLRKLVKLEILTPMFELVCLKDEGQDSDSKTYMKRFWRIKGKMTARKALLLKIGLIMVVLLSFLFLGFVVISKK